MGGNSKNQTSTSTSEQTQTPRGLDGLRDIWARVQQAASTPYTPYGGQMVAGLTPEQTAGIANINGAATSAQPWFNQARDYATQGASAIDPSDINRYFNPYTSSVIDATQANFNEGNAVQQQQVVGNAAIKGALGGDRVGVAQSELARQQKLAQDPTIAGLQQQGWQQALTAAQADRSAASQGAMNFGNLGTGAQGAAIAGGQAQIGAGGVAQQNQQQQLNALYQQYMQAQAFPYQQAAFMAGTGGGILGAMGGTTSGSGSQTTPGPSPWGQLLGAGMTAASLFSDKRVKRDIEVVGKTFDGQPIYKFRYIDSPATHIGLIAQDVEQKHPEAVGLVGGIKTVDYDSATADAAKKRHFADGGLVSPFDAQGYIPQVQMSPMSSSMPQAYQFPGAPGAQPSSSSPFAVNLSGLGGKLGSMFGGGAASVGNGQAGSESPWGAATAPGGFQFNYRRGGPVRPGRYSHGGLIEKIRAMREGMSNGGTVMDTMRDPNGIYVPRFAEGGGVGDDIFSGGFGNSPMPAWSSIPFAPPGQATPFASPAALPIPTQAPQNIASAPITPSFPIGAPESPMASAMAGPDGSGGDPGLLKSLLSKGASAFAGADAPQGDGAPKGGGIFTNFGLSEDARLGMMAAGLGMMASKSPHVGTAIGEGGLAGLSAYTASKTNKQKAELEARKLVQQADQFNRTLDETKSYHHTLEQSRSDASQARLDIASRTAYPGKGTNENGDVVDGLYQFNPEARQYDFKPGVVLTAKGAANSGNAILDDATIGSMAQQYRAGDKSVLQNLGRGAQGAENVVKLRTQIAKQMKDEGVSGKEQAVKMAEFSGLTAGQRTLGNRTANVEMASAEFSRLAPLALTASEKVNRTQYPALNSVLLAAEKGTGDENTVRLGIAVNSLINTYARAISPTGVPTVSDKDHARELLSSAWSKGQFNAAIDQLTQETDAARKSPGDVKDKFREMYGDAPHGAAPAAAASGTAKVTSKEQYDALPPGTKYLDPNGTVRTKQ